MVLLGKYKVAIGIITTLAAMHLYVKLLEIDERIDKVNVLRIVERNIKIKIPIEIDEMTVLTNFEFLDGRNLYFVYEYMVGITKLDIENDMGMEAWDHNAKMKLENEVCNDKYYKSLLSMNVSIVFNYVGYDKINISKFYLNESVCKL